MKKFTKYITEKISYDTLIDLISNSKVNIEVSTDQLQYAIHGFNSLILILDDDSVVEYHNKKKYG